MHWEVSPAIWAGEISSRCALLCLCIPTGPPRCLKRSCGKFLTWGGKVTVFSSRQLLQLIPSLWPTQKWYGVWSGERGAGKIRCGLEQSCKWKREGLSEKGTRCGKWSEAEEGLCVSAFCRIPAITIRVSQYHPCWVIYIEGFSEHLVTIIWKSSLSKTSAVQSFIA